MKRNPHPRSSRPRPASSPPRRLTGCVSVISYCRHASPAYLRALRSYASVYADYQAYLAPPPPDSIGSEGRRALEIDGLDQREPAPAAADLPPLAAPFSDEEIEGCGYLSWLRH